MFSSPLSRKSSVDHLGGCPDPDPSSCCSSNSQKKGPLHCGCPNCDLPNASFQFCQQKEEICGSSSSSAYFVASQSWDSSSAEDGGQVAAVPTCHDGSSVQCVSSSYGAGTCYCADENVEFGVQCEDDSCSDELNARSGGSQGSTRTINWLPYIFGGVMLAGMFAFAMKKRDSKREIKGSVGKKALSDLGTEGDGSTVGDDASSGAFEVGLHGQVAYANADTLEAVDPVTRTNAAKRPRGFLSMFGFGLCRGQNRAEI